MQESGMLQVATPTDTTIVMTRTFDAPRRLVWDAMTKAELVRRWMFCPPGWSWATCEMDVRVGGAYRWEWNGPDGQLAMTIRGVHREVDPPRKFKAAQIHLGAVSEIEVNPLRRWLKKAGTELWDVSSIRRQRARGKRA